MVRSFKAIRSVTRDGGGLYLDTRSWEWFRTKSALWWPGRSEAEKDGRHTIIWHATIPKRWLDPHIIETVHIVEKGREMTVESHPVTFYAFRFPELRSRLRKAGFGKIKTNYRRGAPNYWVVAQAV